MVELQARQNNALRGALWMVACAFFYTVETSIIRALGPGWPSPVTLFWREVATCTALLPLVIYLRGAPLRTRQPKMLLFRSVTGTIGLLLSIYAIARLPLATATTLSFTRPMWIAVLAAVFLGEAMHRWKAASLIIGFAGVVWIVRPGGDIADPLAAMADIAAAFVFAASLVSIRYMTSSESTLTILVYGQLLGLILTTPLAIYFWRTPNGQELAILLSVGLVSLGTTFSYIRALTLADASVAGPLEYLRLPFAMVAGLLLLGEVPQSATLIGAGLILSGAALGLFGERRKQSEPPPEHHIAEAETSRSTEAIKAYFIDQIKQQRAEADKHRFDPYWTDSRTGRNVSVDEYEALYVTGKIDPEPSTEETGNATAYANRLLSELAVTADRYRANAQDPDGYGIATIGTIERCVRMFAFPVSPDTGAGNN